jgi:hypothetical protein
MGLLKNALNLGDFSTVLAIFLSSVSSGSSELFFTATLKTDVA